MTDDKPRWLDTVSAARYLDVRPDALPRLVRQGRIPPPNYALGKRSPRWDRHALDVLFGAAAISTTDEVIREIVEDFRNAKAQSAARAARRTTKDV